MPSHTPYKSCLVTTSIPGMGAKERGGSPQQESGKGPQHGLKMMALSKQETYFLAEGSIQGRSSQMHFLEEWAETGDEGQCASETWSGGRLVTLV